MLKVDSNKCYLWFVALLWAINPILRYTVTILGKLPVIEHFSMAIVVIGVGLIGLLSFRSWKIYIKLKDIVLYLLFLIVFLIEYVCFPRNDTVLDKLFITSLIQAVPFLFFGLIINIEEVETVLYKVSVASLFVQLFYFWAFLRMIGYTSGDNLTGDQIVAAYMTLPHFLVVLWQTFKKPNIFNVVLSVLGIVLMLSFSNRGSMVAIAFFVLMYVLFVDRGSLKFKIGVSVFIVLVIVFFEPIVNALYTFTSNIGMSVGIFDRLFEGELDDSNGRSEIWSQLWPRLGDSVFGLGIGADRVIVGTYSHNMVVEVLLSFGIVFGGIILVILFCLIIGAFLNASSKAVRAFILILFSSSIMKLMFSGSFIVEPYLYLLIGYCIASLRQSKSKLKTAAQ